MAAVGQGIAEIRTGIEAFLLGTEGVNDVWRYFRDQAPAVFPTVLLGDARATVTFGARERWVWRLPLSIVLGRGGGDYAEETRVLEEMYPRVLQRIRDNYTLGGLVLGLAVVDYSEGGMKLAGEDFHAASVLLEISMDTTGHRYQG